MPFPVTSLLDDFNRANEGPPPSSNWTNNFDAGTPGGFKVVSNQCTANSLPCESYWSAAQFGPNMEVWATFAAVPTTGSLGMYVRIQSAGTGSCDSYGIIAVKATGGPTGDTVKIYRMDNAVHTQLGATITRAFAAGDSFGVRIIGSTIEAWYKASAGSWTLLGSRTDSTYSGNGYLGLMNATNAFTLDDFGGGTIKMPALRRRPPMNTLRTM